MTWLRETWRELAVFALFVVLSVLMTWPLAVHLDRAIREPGDPFFTTWAMEWDYYATFHRGVHLFDANIFYPAKQALAFSEHMYGVSLPFFPLFALGIPPLTIHNIALLLGFAFNGYAAFALCRLLTGRGDAALIGGIAYAFIGFRFHHLPHLHFVWTPWLPLMLVALLRYAEAPTIYRAIWFAAALVMNGLTSLHWLVFGSVAIVLTILLLAAKSERLGDGRFWGGIAIAALLAGIVLWPFVQPYREVARLYGMQRSYRETITNSAFWHDWLAPNLQNKLYAKWSPGSAIGHERTLFPGLTILLLAASAFLLSGSDDLPRTIAPSPPANARRPWIVAINVIAGLALIAALIGAIAGDVHLKLLSFRGPGMPLLIVMIAVALSLWFRFHGRMAQIPPALSIGLLWIVLGALGARGLRGWFHTLLFEHLSAFRGIRVPVRWSIITYTGLATFAATGMLPLLRGRSRVARVAITSSVAVLMLFELRAAPLRWFLVPLDPRPVYSWLSTTPISGAVVELPMTQDFAYEYLWRATVHHKPLVNGVSSYLPRDYENLLTLYNADPITAAFTHALEERHCSIVIVHAGGLAKRPAVRDWLRESLASGRMIFLRRFDAGSRGDYVFALTSVEPLASRWRAPEAPDPASRTPSENVELFLRNDAWTYNALTFGNLEFPPMGTIRGPMTILGWALSPSSVKRVELHFGNGRVSVTAPLQPRTDVTHALPWYPGTDRVSFAVQFAEPPRGIRGETDMQVEIVDGRGRSTFLSPSFFNWYPKPRVFCRWDEAKLDELLQRVGGDATKHRQRLIENRETIRDIIDPLTGDADYETDLAFAERIVVVLIGHPDAHLTNRYVELLARGTSRERVLDDVVTSREFASEYLRGGVVSLD